MVNSLNIRFEGNSKALFQPTDLVKIVIEMKLEKVVKKAKGE
jgi:hypothetical protein